MAVTVSANGLKLIRECEGLRLKTYGDIGHVLSIGYGHTGAGGPPPVRPGDRITTDEAEKILRADAQRVVDGIDRLVHVPLEQHERDALACFVFNEGLTAFSKSTMLRLLNGGDKTLAADEFQRWTKAAGRSAVPDLVERRRVEEALFRGKP